MDSKSFNYLNELAIDNISLIKYDEMEDCFPKLKDARKNRSKVEYFFTCSPAVCKMIIEKNSKIESITYLDADLFFFSNPKPIFDEIKDKSIAIIEHRFSLITRPNLKYGKFNVGWITFLNDAQGIKCLNEWFEDCINWCYQKVDGSRYADQKYLNTWPDKYENLIIIKNKGANLAPWNISNYSLTKKDDGIYVDSDKLIFYHFANLNRIGKNEFKTNLSRVFVSTIGIIKDHIYLPYLNEIQKNSLEAGIQSVPKQKFDHKSFFINILAKMSRKIRDFLFNDVIEIN